MTARSVSHLLLALAAILPLLGEAHAGKDPRVKGGRLPFHLRDLDGNAVSSEDPRFQGKVLLVDLWGSWCPPCLSEIPTFNDLHARYSGQGLVVVGIAFENETDPEARRSRLREFVAEKGMSYLILDGGSVDDVKQALPTLRGMNGFPVEIFIDRSGIVVESRYGYGYKDSWAREMDSRLATMLAQPVAEPAPPAPR